MPTIRLTFGWLLRSPMQQEPSNCKAPSPSIYFFNLSLYSPPETMGTRPPPRVPPIRIASPTPIPPPIPSFGWLLHISIKRQPPKTGAPPISQFFHGGHFGAQNKGTKRSARKPGRRAPLLGSWGAAAPRFGSVADVAMEREGKAAGGIVGWQRLTCLCVVVVCVRRGPKLVFP
jgi:hypothetical protein